MLNNYLSRNTENPFQKQKGRHNVNHIRQLKIGIRR